MALIVVSLGAATARGRDGALRVFCPFRARTDVSEDAERDRTGEAEGESAPRVRAREGDVIFSYSWSPPARAEEERNYRGGAWWILPAAFLPRRASALRSRAGSAQGGGDRGIKKKKGKGGARAGERWEIWKESARRNVSEPPEIFLGLHSTRFCQRAPGSSCSSRQSFIADLPGGRRRGREGS